MDDGFYSRIGMAYCPDCRQTFEWSEVYYRDYPATRYDPPERVEICPCCGEQNTGIDDAFDCKYCGESYPPDMSSDVDDMCQKCCDDAINRMKKHVEAHGTNTDIAVLSFLLDF